MKLHRTYGIILRYIFLMRRSFDIASDTFYWPTIDLLLWGLTGMYFAKLAPGANVIYTIVSGILFWIIMWRGQYEITVGFLYELWDRNLINIFVSPIKFGEWVLGLLAMGVMKACISFAFASLVGFLLYKVGVLSYGFYLIPFILLLLMNGWWVGFFVCGILMRFGTKIQTFAWTTVAILSPFSGIYYPISVLPKWAQVVAHVIPSSYVFEGARELVQTGKVDMSKILVSFGLNILYLTLGVLFLRWSFRKIFDRGLTSLQ